ncbi:ammonium transporter family-domain-containing protein [Dunaliella salina]|uniref:Ammonium transporter family-domain-containing protein n=1 Tax=Dunaliella salina TaxID=3046 RepID=A0ABQ7FXD7_DUNSA|nr:ammonium transporter family-domain-containing protein [Dunaliella salina]|eukprot:KAF5827023.1 ammonium transporter family-domain-containing protein [Dunaliella salina]
MGSAMYMSTEDVKHYVDEAVHSAVDSALHSPHHGLHGHDGRSLLQLPDSPFTLDDVDSDTGLVESLNQLRQAVSNVQSEVGSKADAASTNVFFLVYGGTIVFLMQLGFAMLTSGFVRTKNINNILLKNLMDASVASICWYVLGYGFAYGVSDHRTNAFIGNHDFALTHTVQENWALAHPEDDPGHESGNLADYFFQWAFVATTATIVSGGVAERITFVGYMSYVVWMVAWVYPVVVHAVWATAGWLHAFVPDDTRVEVYVGSKDDGEYTFADAWGKGAAILNTGTMDYAGSGAVHLTGGLAALIGAWLLGPRVGRFKEDGSLNEEMNSSSNVLVVFGTLILWFGWYAFNPGSQLAIATPGNAAIVARNAVTTTLAAASGGITCLFFKFWRSGQLDVLSTCNGLLSGMVGVTAGPSLVEPWAAIICGAFGALVFYGSEIWWSWTSYAVQHHRACLHHTLGWRQLLPAVWSTLYHKEIEGTS